MNAFDDELRALREKTSGWFGDARPITDKGKVIAAMMLNPENPDMALIEAVISVEAAGKPFLKDGRPTIRFETHVFSRLTKRVFDFTHPHLSTRDFDVNHSWPKERAYDQFNEAFNLAPYEAMQSTSWSGPQIMGFNWAACDFDTPMDFLAAMMKSGDEALFAMVRLIQNWGIDKHLIAHKWGRFSGRYNGDKTGVYARRLARAYSRHKSNPLQWSADEIKAVYVQNSRVELGADEPSNSLLDGAELVETIDEPEEPTTVERRVPWWRKLLELFA